MPVLYKNAARMCWNPGLILTLAKRRQKQNECTCVSILKTHGVLLTSKGYGRIGTDSKKSSRNKQGYDTVSAEGTCKQIRTLQVEKWVAGEETSAWPKGLKSCSYLVQKEWHKYKKKTFRTMLDVFQNTDYTTMKEFTIPPWQHILS